MMKGALDHMLVRFGRDATVTREGSGVTVTVKVKARPIRPEEAAGGLVDVDAVHCVAQAPDPTVWTLGLFRKGDKVTLDGGLYRMLLVYPMYEGPTLVGYKFFLHG